MDVFAVVEASGHPALATDENGGILTCNRALADFLGEEPGRIVGRALHELVEARDFFGNRARLGDRTIHEMVADGQPVHAFELDLRQSSGGFARMVVSVLPVLGPEPSQYRLIYYLTRRRRRREADEALDVLLKTGVPAGLLDSGSGLRTGGPEEPELTPRERAVVRQLAEGGSRQEVAAALGISVNTLRTHTSRILRKLHAHSKAEAVAKAFRRGLL